MEIFKYNIYLSNFEEARVGLIHNLINPSLVINLCLANKILSSNEEKAIKLCVEECASFTEFLEVIEDISRIEMQEKNSNFDGLRIWKLEDLLKACNEKKDKKEILEKIYELFYFYNFPEDWVKQNFLLYTQENGYELPIEKLYQNLESFISKERLYFLETQSKE